ncbi:hypothetical protein Ancab_011975 [Ancistrocladus abbreviatus]
MEAWRWKAVTMILFMMSMLAGHSTADIWKKMKCFDECVGECKDMNCAVDCGHNCSDGEMHSHDIHTTNHYFCNLGCSIFSCRREPLAKDKPGTCSRAEACKESCNKSFIGHGKP